MSNEHFLDGAFGSLSAMEGTDRVCDAFEDAWRAGERPDITQYASQVAEPRRPALVYHLLLLDWDYRRRHGETLSADEYRSRLAGVQDAVERAFQEIAAKESLPAGPAGADSVHSRLDSTSPTRPSPRTRRSESGGQSGGADCHEGELPRIPGYEVVGRIARGGMGEVLKARHQTLDRWVAIKRPLRELADEADRTRFLREARAAAQLRHANICPIYEVGESDGLPYLAMAYIQGQTLAHSIRERRLTAHGAAQVVATLARAVDFAHQHGLVHRDIKPGNVMVDEETGNPILMDFGLAKNLSEADSQLTASGQILGTPAYMAPEQAAGRLEDVGPATDVYGLGAVLYELLAGRRPFEGKAGEIIRMVQSEEPAPPGKLAPNLHRDLETICLKAIAKNPTARYASAAELAEDLERFCTGEAILARRAGAAARLARWLRRHYRTAAAFLLVLVLASVAVRYFARGADDARRLSAIAASLNEGFRVDAWTTDHLRQLELLVDKLRPLDPELASRSENQLHAQYANYLDQQVLTRPVLTPGDLEEVRAALAWLEPRDPQAAAMLNDRLAQRLRQWQPLFEVAPPFEVITAVFPAAQVRVADDQFWRAAAPTEFWPLLVSVPQSDAIQFKAVFGNTWQSASEIGLALKTPKGRGYEFLLRLPPGPARRLPTAVEDETAPSFGQCSLVILRDGEVLRQQPLPLETVAGRADGELHLVATRERDRLSLQVNDLPPLMFQDIIALSSSEQLAFALSLPLGVGVTSVAAWDQLLPASPSPLQLGDDLFARGQWEAALDQFRRQAIAAQQPAHRDEARYKEALCLARLKREAEAVPIFEELIAGTNDQVRILASCQLWLIRLKQRSYEDIELIHETVRSQYTAEQLAMIVPETLRAQIVGTVQAPIEITFFQFNERHLRDLERAVAIHELLTKDHADARAWYLVRGYHITGHVGRAMKTAERLFADQSWQLAGLRYSFVEEYCWLLRQTGEAEKALVFVDRVIDQAASRGLPEATTLLVERARILAALDRWDEAEQTIDRFLASPLGRKHYRHFSAACLMRGFLHQQRGETAQATESWSAGLYKNWLQKTPEQRGLNGLDFASAVALAALTRDLSDADLTELTRDVAGIGSSFANEFIQQNAHRLTPYLRGMAETPAAEQRLREFAFQQVTLKQCARIPAGLILVEMSRQAAPPPSWSAEHEEIVWQVAHAGLDQYAEGTLTHVNLVQLWAASKGVTNILGWQGIAPALAPELRAPAAYLMGHRLLRLEQPGEAAAMFQLAVDGAPPNSSLEQLATAALEFLGSGSE